AVLGMATVLILLLAGANIAGVRWGARIQNLTVSAKVLTLLAIGATAGILGRFDVFGAAAPAPGAPAPLGPVSAVLAALVPAIFLLAGTSLALLLAAGADGVNTLLNGVVFVDSAFFVLTGAALIALRRKRPDAERPVRVPGYPVVPGLFVIGEAGVLIGAY